MPVTQANLDCEHVTSGSTTNETLSYLFDNLINIIPSVTIDVGAEYDAHILDCDLDGSWTKTLKTWSLPTHCLAYDNNTKALVVAAVPSRLAASAAASSVAAGLHAIASNAAKAALSPGTIAGICIGAILGVALLAAGGFFLWQHQRRSRITPSPKNSPEGYEATRAEEQYDDENESKVDADIEVRSYVPSRLSSTYDVR